MSSDISTKDKRCRSFATIVYPESAPADWYDVLSSQCIPCLVSPLHDKDINPGSDEPKKAHYHVVLCYDGKKSIEQVQPVFDAIGGVGCVQVQSIRGMARYLCHLDNPEKHQYDTNDVRALGLDYLGIIGLATDKYVALGEMQDFCEEYNVVSFYALSKYARTHRPDWHRILCDCGSVFMREYLNSRKWSREQGLDSIIDPNTGEKID